MWSGAANPSSIWFPRLSKRKSKGPAKEEPQARTREGVAPHREGVRSSRIAEPQTAPPSTPVEAGEAGRDLKKLLISQESNSPAQCTARRGNFATAAYTRQSIRVVLLSRQRLGT